MVAPRKILMGICRSWSRSFRSLDYAEPTLLDRILCPSLKRECQLTNQPNLQGDGQSEIYLPGLSPAPSV